MNNYLDFNTNLKLLRELVEIKSPYFHEDEVALFVNDWLNANNVPAEIHSYYEGKETKFHGKNVVGILDSGKEGPVIYLGGHYDTVNLCTGWTREPYTGSLEGDFFYGIGALDMKAGCASIMLALAEFVSEHKDDFIGKIIYHFVSDEEGPYGLGTTFIINDNIHNLKAEADFAIIAEPSAGFTGRTHPCICLGARGGYNYKIKVHGRAAHAALPDSGINALSDAAKIIYELDHSMPRHDDKLGDSARCVIDLRTSGNACSVPEYAEIEVFHHNVRGETVEIIKAEVEAAIKRAKIKGSADICFRQSPAAGFDGGFMPYCIDENDKHLKILEASIDKVCDKKAQLAYFQSIGDFNHIGGLLNIPTVLLGPDGENFHSADERVNMKSAWEITKVIYDFILSTNTTNT